MPGKRSISVPEDASDDSTPARKAAKKSPKKATTKAATKTAAKPPAKRGRPPLPKTVEKRETQESLTSKSDEAKVKASRIPMMTAEKRWRLSAKSGKSSENGLVLRDVSDVPSGAREKLKKDKNLDDDEKILWCRPCSTMLNPDYPHVIQNHIGCDTHKANKNSLR
eukprot:TRINITY_DN18493_c0_g1_i2.p1 TRINITY_DN18493_c0_g1~~TRINITY_DN18493_c0_g1_i2.p1  ORF type:complete len:166 (-),score=35.48 TRINITY_DN18493_c0_g1_i2:59-556(-)